MPSFGVITLGSGVTKSSGQIINLATINSNITLNDNIVGDTFGNTGNNWLINGSTAPVYILNFPYTYSSTASQTNVSGRSGVAATITIDDSTVFETGIKIYQVSSYLTSAPIMDSANKKFSFSTVASGSSKIFVASEGKPIKINVDGQDRIEGDGWSWSTSDSVASVVSGTQIIVWFGGGGGGGGGGGAPQVPLVGDGVVGDVIDVFGSQNQNNNILFGSFAIIIITVSVLSYKELEKKSSSINKNWSKQISGLNKPVKGWDKHRKRPKN